MPEGFVRACYGLDVDPFRGTVTGSIEYGAAYSSPYDVTVTVTNGSRSASAAFQWYVTPAPPAFDGAYDERWNDLNSAVGDTISVPARASDPNNRPLVYSASGLPPGLSIGGATGIITGTVAAGSNSADPYDVTVEVSNGPHTATLSFPWTITRLGLDELEDRTNTAGDEVSLDFSGLVNDPNGGNGLTYTYDGLPDGLIADPVGGQIVGTIADSAAGGQPWHVTLTVSDGTETVARSFNWTVLPPALPTIALANPGSRVNSVWDPIWLPITATTSAPVGLHFKATGLPRGLEIDPVTGVIAGMDHNYADDTNGNTYSVTVTVTDDYGQTASQDFTWQFLPSGLAAAAANPLAMSGDAGPASSMDAGTLSGWGTVTPNAFGFGSHPTTEARDDLFDVDGFWDNVERLPGGQAAEGWFAGRNGRVEWAWSGVTTYGRWEEGTDGKFIPVVYIPQWFNEARASEAFVNNVNHTWVTGFADYTKVPTDGNPVSWRAYIKERTRVSGEIAATGAELYLSGLSIVSEGADWVVTVNDIASANTLGGAAVAAISFLPFVSGTTLKIVRNGSAVLEVTPAQRKLINEFLNAKGQTPDAVAIRLRSLLNDYWKHSGGITVDEATQFAKDFGFKFEIGRVSRFENARNAVIIAKADLLDGKVNRILLAEEIQHGIDRATAEASRAIRRGLTNEQFHARVFQRIVDRYAAGKFQFLTPDDIAVLLGFVARLKK